MPPLAAMTALSPRGRSGTSRPSGTHRSAATAALGYVALAWFEKPALRVVWAQFALGFGSVALLFAHPLVTGTAPTATRCRSPTRFA
ncbi:MAG: hypothetical protein U0837_18085 [Dehalococcoidia bacterium]